MEHLLVLKANSEKSHVEVKYTHRGRDIIPFKSGRMNFFVYDKRNNEFFAFNRFTGGRIKNYLHPENKLGYKPDEKKEKGILFKQLEELDIISLNFLNWSKNDFSDDFPELLEESAAEYKKRFKL